MSLAVDAAETTRKLFRGLKNFMGYEEVENLVRNATSNSADIPTTSQLMTIRETLLYFENYPKMSLILWRRLCDLQYKRHVFKSLMIFDYLIRLKPPSRAVQLRLIVDVRERWNDLFRLSKLPSNSSSETIRQIQRVAERLCDFIERFERGECESEELSDEQKIEEKSELVKKKKAKRKKKKNGEAAGESGSSAGSSANASDNEDRVDSSSFSSNSNFECIPPTPSAAPSNPFGFDFLGLDNFDFRPVNEGKPNFVPADPFEGIQSTDWNCKQCGVINPSSNKKCRNCDSPSSDNSSISSDSPDWNCNFCSFLNPSKSANCDICENPRDHHPDTHKHNEFREGGEMGETGSDQFIDEAGEPESDEKKSSEGKSNPFEGEREMPDLSSISGTLKNPRLLLPGAWACAWCSWLNGPTSTSCEVCERDGGRSSMANQVKLAIAQKQEANFHRDLSWSCPRCSNVNSAGRLNCAACGQRFPNEAKIAGESKANPTAAAAPSQNHLSVESPRLNASRQSISFPADFPVASLLDGKSAGGFASGRSAAPFQPAGEAAAGAAAGGDNGDLLSLVNSQQRSLVNQLQALESFQTQQEKVRSQSGWACQVCSYINMPKYSKCEMCDNQREQIENVKSMPSSANHSRNGSVNTSPTNQSRRLAQPIQLQSQAQSQSHPQLPSVNISNPSNQMKPQIGRVASVAQPVAQPVAQAQSQSQIHSHSHPHHSIPLNRAQTLSPSVSPAVHQQNPFNQPQAINLKPAAVPIIPQSPQLNPRSPMINPQSPPLSPQSNPFNSPLASQQQSAAPVPAPAPWVCNSCTFENSADNLLCEICDAPPPATSHAFRALRGADNNIRPPLNHSQSLATPAVSHHPNRQSLSPDALRSHEERKPVLNPAGHRSSLSMNPAAAAQNNPAAVAAASASGASHHHPGHNVESLFAEFLPQSPQNQKQNNDLLAGNQLAINVNPVKPQSQPAMPPPSYQAAIAQPAVAATLNPPAAANANNNSGANRISSAPPAAAKLDNPAAVQRNYSYNSMFRDAAESFGADFIQQKAVEPTKKPEEIVSVNNWLTEEEKQMIQKHAEEEHAKQLSDELFIKQQVENDKAAAEKREAAAKEELIKKERLEAAKSRVPPQPPQPPPAPVGVVKPAIPPHPKLSALEIERRISSPIESAIVRSSSAGSAVSSDSVPPIDKREKVCAEILSTEKYYCDCLQDTINIIMEPLKKNSAKFSVSSKQISAIFSNLPILAQFHLMLYTELSRSKNIPAVFVKYADFLKMYTQYLNEYEKSIATINSLRSNKHFQKFLDDTRQQLKGNSLMSLKISVVQRIPRYVLLLRELKKNTPADHPDAETLDIAISKVELIGKHVNESKRHVENMSKLLDIQHRLKKKDFVLFKPDRRLLREGSLKRVRSDYLGERSNEPAKPQDLEETLFFLFNDLLLWTSKEFELIGSAPVGSLVIAPTQLKHFPHVLSLIVKGKPYSPDMTWACSDATEKEEWVRYLTAAIVSQNDPKAAKRKLEELESAPPVKEQKSAEIQENKKENNNAAVNNSNNANNPPVPAWKLFSTAKEMLECDPKVASMPAPSAAQMHAMNPTPAAQPLNPYEKRSSTITPPPAVPMPPSMNQLHPAIPASVHSRQLSQPKMQSPPPLLSAMSLSNQPAAAQPAASSAMPSGAPPLLSVNSQRRVSSIQPPQQPGKN